jgi:hypothetical protein
MSDKFKPVGLVELCYFIFNHFRDDTKSIDEVLNPDFDPNELSGKEPPEKVIPKKTRQKQSAPKRYNRNR